MNEGGEEQGQRECGEGPSWWVVGLGLACPVCVREPAPPLLFASAREPDEKKRGAGEASRHPRGKQQSDGYDKGGGQLGALEQCEKTRCGAVRCISPMARCW